MAEEQAQKEEPPTRKYLYVYGDNVTGRKRPTNYFETLTTMIKGYIGTGIFAMGSAFLYSGLLLGSIFLVGIALIALHCQHILIRAAVKLSSKESVKVAPSYAETVRYTFEDSASKKFQKCAKTVFFLTNLFVVMAKYGVAVVYLIFISTHIKKFSDNYEWVVDYRIWLAILILPIWLPTILTNLKYLAPFMVIANVIIFVGIGIILYYTSQNLQSIKDRRLVVDFVEWPKSIGICLFSFQSISFILNVHMEMRDQEKFNSPLGVMNVAMTIVIIFNFFVGFMSFWKYNTCIKGSTFLNLPAGDILAQIAKTGIAVATIFSYTFHMYIPFEVLYPMFYRKWGPFKHPNCIMALYRTFWVFVTYALANIDDRLDAFIGLTGGIASSAITLIFPTLIELAMLSGNLKVWIVIKDIGIIVIAVIAALTAVALSAKDIVEHVRDTVEGHINATDCTP